jgi:hypothetical protein
MLVHPGRAPMAAAVDAYPGRPGAPPRQWPPARMAAATRRLADTNIGQHACQRRPSCPWRRRSRRPLTTPVNAPSHLWGAACLGAVGGYQQERERRWRGDRERKGEGQGQRRQLGREVGMRRWLLCWCWKNGNEARVYAYLCVDSY